MADTITDAGDLITDGLTAKFDRATLSKLLDDARDMEHGAGRDTRAWEELADLIWEAYSRSTPTNGASRG